MLPWSVTATVSIPSSVTLGNRSFTRIAPSSRLYCVCRWRCVKPAMVGRHDVAHAHDTPEPRGRVCDGLVAGTPCDSSEMPRRGYLDPSHPGLDRGSQGP